MRVRAWSMGRAGTGDRGKKSGDVSAVEAFRIYREFKKLQKEAGIAPYDPKDTEAIRKGFFGDGYDASLSTIEKSRKTGPSR